MPRNDAARLYMAAQVTGRTIERQANWLSDLLRDVSNGNMSARGMVNHH